MSHTEIAAVFAAAALAALALLVPVVRTALSNRDIDRSAVLAFGTAACFSFSSALTAVTGALQRRPDVFGNLTAYEPGWFHRVDQLALAAVVALVGWLLYRQARSGALYVHAAGLLAIALWAVAHVSSGLHDEALVTPRGAVLLLCLVAATMLPRGRGAAFGVGVFGVLLAAVGGILALFRYDVAFVVPCEGACSKPGFTGVLPNENLLGIALLASIPFAYLGFRGRTRFWLSLYLAAMAGATGSRTALAGSAIVLVGLGVVRPRLDVRMRLPRWRTLVAGSILAGSVVSSVYVVRHHWSSTSLTTRPALWGVAWHYIHRSPWFGYGPEKWASLYQSSQIPVAAQRTSHNQWTDILFVSGGVGAALFIGMALAAILSSGRARAGVMFVLATIFLIGTTEGAWTIGTLDILSFSLVAFILTGEASPVSTLVAVAAAVPSAVPVPRPPRRPRRIAHPRPADF
jgi:hypothetical protein